MRTPIWFKLTIFLLLFSASAQAAIDIKNNGTHQGYANVIDFTTGQTATVSGITATVSSSSSGVTGITGGSGGTTTGTTVTVTGTSPISTSRSGDTITAALGTVTVANGGTGSLLYIPNSPLFAGTTSTSAVQNGSLGSAGQVLTSNGTSAVPTFQAASGGSPGGTGSELQFRGGASTFSALTGSLSNNTFTGSSGTQTNLTIAPTISQSGTAGYDALLINPTESSTGSGNKYPFEVQVGSVNKAYIDDTGKFVCTGNGAGQSTINLGLTVNTSSTSAASLLFQGGTDANLLSVQGSNDRVGIGTASPKAKLNVVSTSASVLGLVSTGAVGQTSDLFQGQNSSQTVQFAVSATGSLNYSGGVKTAGSVGVPSVYGYNRATGQTAANASVATYTDEGNTARTLTLNFQTIAGVIGTTVAFANGAVPYEGVAVHLRCKASTAITIKTAAGGTYTGCTYNVEGIIAQI